MAKVSEDIITNMYYQVLPKWWPVFLYSRKPHPSSHAVHCTFTNPPLSLSLSPLQLMSTHTHHSSGHFHRLPFLSQMQTRSCVHSRSNLASSTRTALILIFTVARKGLLRPTLKLDVRRLIAYAILTTRAIHASAMISSMPGQITKKHA